MKTIAITLLLQIASDREIHKELIDTKFVYFFKGLVLVLSSSTKVYTNIRVY